MNQNQTVDNDLQKAIDDITNTTNVDPVFADPIATPPVPPMPDLPPVATETPLNAPIEAPLGVIEEPSNVPPVAPIPPVPPVAEPIEMPELPKANEPKAGVVEEAPISTSEKPEISKIREAALRDLLPLLDKVNLDPSQKFDIYKEVFENAHDNTILEPAYNAAKEISDETKRAEALLYIIETIGKN